MTYSCTICDGTGRTYDRSLSFGQVKTIYCYCPNGKKLKKADNRARRAADRPAKLEKLLREYHDIMLEVDIVATRQEDHLKKLGELAALARSNAPEAQMQLRQYDRTPKAFDYGNAIQKLRLLKKKSSRLLGVK